jgi:hypothetical protein
VQLAYGVRVVLHVVALALFVRHVSGTGLVFAILAWDFMVAWWWGAEVG